jgi:hypothetical protein
MDREHPARLFPRALAFGVKATGPRSACCASSHRHRPLLQQALRGPCSGETPIAPPLKSKSEGEHFSVGRRLQLAPAEGPGRVVHAKKVGHNKAVTQSEQVGACPELRRVARAPMGMFARKGGGRHSPPHCWRWRYHSGHTHPRSLSLSPRSSMARSAGGWIG